MGRYRVGGGDVVRGYAETRSRSDTEQVPGFEIGGARERGGLHAGSDKDFGDRERAVVGKHVLQVVSGEGCGTREAN